MRARACVRVCVWGWGLILYDSESVVVNGVARIDFWGGQLSVISGGRPDSVGGGGSSRDFPGSP